jgi:cytochrome c551/c552
MKWKNHDAIWIYVFAILLLGVTMVVYAKHYRPEWKKYQAGFKDLVTQRFGPDKAAKIPNGLQQVWIKDLNRTDRCVTCHQGVEWNGLEDAREPYRSHPKGVLAKHPIAKYGCTSCHGGQGYAADARSAHATMIDFWEEPMLGPALAKSHQVDDPKALIQINCNICHRYDKETPGADYINTAKVLADELGCNTCHKVNGTGMTVGPDLTYVGDHAPEHFDFSRISDVKTVFGWHVAHFSNPEGVAGQTEMPNLNMEKRDAQALAMLVMSWKRVNLPMEYIHKPHGENTQAADGNANAGQAIKQRP